MNEVDFVILWVDGNDPQWQDERSKYVPSSNTDVRYNRYRDWDLLPYWFRGVEKFTPWFRKIHFVTCGHLPKWLNVDNPKLSIVKHEDYIPKEYLPTFNSNTIELNLHRIRDLSEDFVYFNDDMFILRPMDVSAFFKNGLPCDVALLDTIGATEIFSYILFNNLYLINKNFNKKSAISSNRKKWINLCYSLNLYRTIVLYPWRSFTGFYNPHLPIPFNIETYREVWEKEYKELNSTCKNRFRSASDVSGWLFRYWRIVKGDFFPASPSVGKYYDTSDANVYDAILKQKYGMVCINDDIEDDSFDTIKNRFVQCFRTILPEKSSFER